MCHSYAALVLWLLGYPEQAQQRIEEALSLTQELGHPFSLAYALSHMAIIHRLRREAPATYMRAEAGAVMDTMGERWWAPELHRLRGELLLTGAGEDRADAEACFHQALKVAHRQQAEAQELRAARSLSRLWQRQGKREEARQLLAERDPLTPAYRRPHRWSPPAERRAGRG